MGFSVVKKSWVNGLVSCLIFLSILSSFNFAIAGGGKLEQLRLAAAGGDLTAMSNLAVALLTPHWKNPENIDPKDLEEALSLLELASRLEYPAAKFNLARTILRGFATQRTKEDALDLLRSAAAKNHVQATTHLADLLKAGKEFLPVSSQHRVAQLAEACDLYEKLGNQGDRSAQLKYHEIHAEAGEVRAMVQLVAMLEDGIGCEKSPQNLAKALFWREKAAEAEQDLKGMHTIANRYLNGIGCEHLPLDVRRARALELLHRSADKGLVVSQVELARLYYEGKEVKRDLHRSLGYLEPLKDELGVFLRVAEMYLELRNLPKALENFKLALTVEDQQSHASIRKVIQKVEAAISQSQPTPAPRARRRNKAKPGEEARSYFQAQLERKRAEVEAKYKKVNQLFEKLYEPREDGVGDIKSEAKRAELLNDYEFFSRMYEKAEDISSKNTVISKYEAVLKSVEKDFVQLLQKKRKVSVSPVNVNSSESTEYSEVSGKEETRSQTRETKSAALEKESKANLAAVKKKLKKKKKLSAAKKARLREEAEVKRVAESKRKADEMIRVFRPYQNTEIKYRVPVELLAAVKENMEQVYWTIQSLEIEEGENPQKKLIAVLRDLEGDFDFKDIALDYARLPKAKEAFEMRINGQYRVVIAFDADSTLHHGKIYIDDLH